MQQQRLAKLKNILKKKGVDALFITDPLDIYYISGGFKTDVSCLLISQNANIIITDFRYKQDAEDIPGFQVRLIDGNLQNTLKSILKYLKIRRLGFEAEYLTFVRAKWLNKLAKREGIICKALENIVAQMRLYKDEAEIREIKKAVDISKRVFFELKRELRPGVTEKRLAAIVECMIRNYGGDTNSFETIIASGKNSSRPHANTTSKVIANNEHVLVDFGVKLNGYNCDLTRIFFLGKIQSTLKTIYNICKEAQELAIKTIRAGVKIKDVDMAARGYIASKGFGKYFGHSLGHGVGLAVHEPPRIFSKNNSVLRPGMIFTIEPGIYLEDLGGMRLEDMVLVTQKGCEVLSYDIPK